MRDIPSLHDLAALAGDDILLAALDPHSSDALDRLSQMMVDAGMGKTASLDVLFSHVATADGLFRAADAMRALEREEQANALADLAHMFLKYCMTDIGLMAATDAWNHSVPN